MTLALGHRNTATKDHVLSRAFLKANGIKPSKINKHNLAAAGAACNMFKADKPLADVKLLLEELKFCRE